MKPKNKAEELFELSRSLPTELSHEHIASMVFALPKTAPVQPHWTQRIHLNSIVVALVSTTLIISGLLFLTPQKTAENTPIDIATEKTPTIADTPTDAIHQPNIVYPQNKQAQSKSLTSPMSDQPTDIAPVPMPIYKMQEQLEQPSKIEDTGDTDLPVHPAKYPTIELPETPEIFETISHYPRLYMPTYPRYGTMDDGENYVELSGRTMKKLKKKLLHKLAKDKIIPSQKTPVEIVLPGEKIVVNGRALSHEFFKKYADLLDNYAIGFGPHRKIQINAKSIKVGDFTEYGFKGSGMGTFSADFFNSQQATPSQLQSENQEKRPKAPAPKKGKRIKYTLLEAVVCSFS